MRDFLRNSILLIACVALGFVFWTKYFSAPLSTSDVNAQKTNKPVVTIPPVIVQTNAFIIALPENMALRYSSISQDNEQFQYWSKPYNANSPLRMYVTITPGILDAQKVVSQLVAEYESHPYSNQSKEPLKKPELIKLGEQSFASQTGSRATVQLHFLATTTKNATYGFTLICDNKDKLVCKKQMDEMLFSIKDIQYSNWNPLPKSNRQDITTPAFTLNLPSVMKLTDELVFTQPIRSKDRNVYRYVFQAPPYDKTAPTQLEIKVAPDLTPDAPVDLNALVSPAVDTFKSRYGSIKPKNVEHQAYMVGDLPFVMTLLSFEGLDAHVIATLANGASYTMTLTSSDKDFILRKKQMDELQADIKNMTYLGIPGEEGAVITSESSDEAKLAAGELNQKIFTNNPYVAMPISKSNPTPLAPVPMTFNDYFTIHLPENMKFITHLLSMSYKTVVHEYVFQSQPYNNTSSQEMRILVQPVASTDDIDDLIKTLITQGFADVAKDYQLTDLSHYPVEMNDFHLGDQDFTLASPDMNPILSYGNTDVCIVVTIANGYAYTMILSSTDNDAIIRRFQMKPLLESIEYMNYAVKNP
ncbi:MAG TPA: hypothetical protein VGV92_03870 [Gammaproteobacteria bacterium]|nr:hypothetical protein [Gammaproteobacteria bacterium]